MTPDQFLDRCKLVCHVGPVGVWEQISQHGFRTAEQLILASDEDESDQQQLLSALRREPIHISVEGHKVLLKDQGPLFARKDLASIIGEEVDVSDWIRLLNRRVYFFTDQPSMQKMLDKQLESDGAQEVIWLSPLRVLKVEELCLEPTSQKSGAIAPRSGPLTVANTFLPFSSFPDKRPAVLTMVDGLQDLTPVVRVERHTPDGRRDRLFP